MRSQWFVIHTLSGQEQKVKESIEKRLKAEEMGEYVHEVLVPMEKVVEVRNNKKTVSTRKLWPGYVFVDMALLDENGRIIEKPWYFIKETQGVIGFVGLVVPHLLRLVFGADHRFILGGAALLGASLVLAADLLSRTLAAPAEIPLGLLTSALGVPFFLGLLRRARLTAGLV